MRYLLFVFLILVAAACGASKASEIGTEAVAAESGADAPSPTSETAPADALPNDGTRQIGDVTTCPVSGEVFTVTADSPKAEHEGGTYYFCCQGCVEDFVAAPARFLAGAAAEPAEGAAAAE